MHGPIKRVKSAANRNRGELHQRVGVVGQRKSKMADKGSAPKSLVKHSFAGIAAGGISTAILYPLDLVKTRYQIHENSPKAFRSLGQAFVSIVKTDVTGRYNFRALYQGMSPALYGTTLSWGLYFFFYEHAKSFYADQTILPPWVGHFASGIQAGTGRLSCTRTAHQRVAVGAMCVPLTNPIWLVKVRMQVQATHPSQVPYKNMANALQRIAVEEGISALYKGVVPALFLTTHGAFKVLTSPTSILLIHATTE
ncbi:hypothetical protein DYB32_009266 [Aphanomyces invadans]|uniref:Mitochondrial folate transporter/carrier n=1 Tax=Aphanomyces invadans TaxID=157072 RepID=A0A3R6WFL8_9STRA|nr:hypothetical protein DYB32_009266 [Aphanomyces invadans]